MGDRARVTAIAVRAAIDNRASGAVVRVAPLRDVGIGLPGAVLHQKRAAPVGHEALVAPIGARRGGEPRSRLSKAEDEEQANDLHRPQLRYPVGAGEAPSCTFSQYWL